METIVIVNKVIINSLIKEISWKYEISNEQVYSYEIQGTFILEEGLELMSDELLIEYLKTNLDIEGFKKQCYSDLGLDII